MYFTLNEGKHLMFTGKRFIEIEIARKQHEKYQEFESNYILGVQINIQVRKHNGIKSCLSGPGISQVM